MSAKQFYVQGTLLSLLMVALLVFTSLQAYGLLMAGSPAFWIGIVQVIASLAGLVFIGGSTLRRAAKGSKKIRGIK